MLSRLKKEIAVFNLVSCKVLWTESKMYFHPLRIVRTRSKKLEESPHALIASNSDHAFMKKTFDDKVFSGVKFTIALIIFTGLKETVK